MLEVGSGRFIPGFEEQLIGATVGEERELNVSFPAEYPAEDVAGKDAVFAVTIHGIQRKQTPELDDAFAASLDMDGVDSVETLRDRVKADITERRDSQAKEALHRSVVDALIERTDFEVPPGLTDRRLQQRLQMAHQELGQFMPHEELHGRLREWETEWRPEAERDVREALLLEAVSGQLEVEVADADVDAKIEELAREQGMAPDRLRSAYEERGMIDALRSRLAEEKALDYLTSEAKVEETTGT